MAPNIIKELQSKIALLERNNKTLTERLGRTEHKVGVLLQWALSFPGLAASQGLTQLKTSTSRTPQKAMQTIRRRSTGRPKSTPKIQSKQRSKKEIKKVTSEVAEDKEQVPSTSQIEIVETKVDDISQSSEIEKIDMEGIQETVEKGISDDFVGLDHTLLPIADLEEPGQQTERFEQMEQDEESIEEGKQKVIQIQQPKFVCTICGSGYAYQHGLSRHMHTVHERLQEFTCKICGKGFYRSDKLRSHELLCAKKATT
ncbi:unnamed protein product [Allacma fusca]|uniref:C2H2-type domain-containing protein n=1 Tax=Allacma fusca TaxID=39272 RepID=A0A8J2JKB4_9HEXA|nr:unnamed protein product [Allacma fusca]